MKRILLGTIVVATLVMTGCSSKNQASSMMHSSYVDPELDDAPAWVLTPVVEGSISEVGSAKKNAGNDISFQRNEAMADARDNIARQISTKTSNMFKNFKAATGSGTDATFEKATESVSKQIASETLQGSIVKGTWISKTGTMYILMAVDPKAVIKKVGEAIKTSYKNDEALYQKFLASQAQGELEAELIKAGN